MSFYKNVKTHPNSRCVFENLCVTEGLALLDSSDFGKDFVLFLLYLDEVVEKTDKAEEKRACRYGYDSGHVLFREFVRAEQPVIYEQYHTDSYRGDRSEHEHHSAHCRSALFVFFVPYRSYVEDRLTEFQLPKPRNYQKSEDE